MRVEEVTHDRERDDRKNMTVRTRESEDVIMRGREREQEAITFLFS